jgi:hypothetical protein
MPSSVPVFALLIRIITISHFTRSKIKLKANSIRYNLRYYNFFYTLITLVSSSLGKSETDMLSFFFEQVPAPVINGMTG